MINYLKICLSTIQLNKVQQKHAKGKVALGILLVEPYITWRPVSDPRERDTRTR